METTEGPTIDGLTNSMAQSFGSEPIDGPVEDLAGIPGRLKGRGTKHGQCLSIVHLNRPHAGGPRPTPLPGRRACALPFGRVRRVTEQLPEARVA
jgi:hypothetical protein